MHPQKDIISKWGSSKRLINKELEAFFGEKILFWSKKDPEMKKAWQHISRVVLSSGKRLRPFLVLWSFGLKDGKGIKKIMPFAVATELLHSYFLIHDDVIDRDDVRHGVPTIHKIYSKDRDLHYGNSIAIVLGDWLCSSALELALEAPIKNDLKAKAFQELTKMISKTIYGETIDVMGCFKRNVSFRELSRKAHEIIKNKTAYYSFISPLKLGCILKNGSSSELELFSKIGEGLGMAYQLKDDLDGVFLDEKDLGKPSGSDMEEKKPTILAIKTLESLNEKEKRQFMGLMGRKLGKGELKKTRDLIEKSGARAWLEGEIEKTLRNLIKTVNSARMDKPRKEELEEIISLFLGKYS